MYLHKEATGQQIYEALDDIISEYVWEYRNCKESMGAILEAVFNNLSKKDQKEVQKIINYYTVPEDESELIEIGKEG